jgi:hypothetical protein
MSRRVTRGFSASYFVQFVLEISILLSFLHSELLNKVIFLQPSVYFIACMGIFENDVLFRKTDLVICQHTS